MNPILKKLLTAPWSGEPVGPLLRIVAWILVVLFGIAFVGGTYMTIVEGLKGMDVELALYIIGCIYLWMLFIYVARKGKAPTGWLPW